MIAIANMVTKERKIIDKKKKECTEQFKQIMSEFYTSKEFIKHYVNGDIEIKTKINLENDCPEIKIRHTTDTTDDLILTLKGQITHIQIIKRPIISQIILDFF